MENVKISVIAKDSADILIRITAVLNRRGFKICNLHFSQEDSMAKIQITINGAIGKRDQVISQLCKLHDIKQAQVA